MKSVRIQLAVVLAAALVVIAVLLVRGPPPSRDISHAIFNEDKAQICRGVSWYAGRVGDRPGGWTALHTAAMQGDETTLVCLISRGDNANATTRAVVESWGRGLSTPLHWAVSPPWGCPSLASCESLVGAGADVEARDEGGRTPLFFAGGRKIAQWLVEECGSDPACRDRSGYTALHFAAWNTREDVIPYLATEAGADINAQANNGETPLHCAAFVGYVQIVDAILRGGADVGIRDGAGATAVHMAALRGDVRTIHRLVRAGADLYATDACGRTVLHYLFSEVLYDAHVAPGINMQPTCWKVYPPRTTAGDQADAAGLLMAWGVDCMIKDAEGKLAVDYCRASALRDYLLVSSRRHDPRAIAGSNPLAGMSEEALTEQIRSVRARGERGAPWPGGTP
jgi:ankyrin repeat protein